MKLYLEDVENIEYKNVLDYLNSIGVTLTIKRKNKVKKPNWGTNGLHNVYDVYIFRDSKRAVFEFTDSIYNTEHNKIMSGNDEASVSSVMYCLVSDYENKGYSYDDFCDEFGYDAYEINYDTNRRVKNKTSDNIYKSVLKNNEKLNRLFSADEINVIREILSDY